MSQLRKSHTMYLILKSMKILFFFIFFGSCCFGQTKVLCSNVKGTIINDYYLFNDQYEWDFYGLNPNIPDNFTGVLKTCESGFLIQKLSVINGIANGEFIWLNDDGQLFQKGNFVNGKKDGEWISYYEDGQIESKGYYINGARAGEWVTYNEHGTVANKGNYINDLKNGYWIEVWTEAGDVEIGRLITSKGNYINSQRTGEWISYYENGQIQAKVNYVFVENVCQCEDDGEENYLNDGEYITYYTNGQISSKGNYKGGELVGEWVSYYENGQIESKENYDLIYVTCYCNEERIDAMGVRNGEQIYYSENGQIFSRGNYVDGLKNGEWIDEGSKGNYNIVDYPFEDGFHFNGFTSVRNGEWVEVWGGEFGRLITSKGNYINSKRTGEWISYYENGQICSKGNYINGLSDGLWIFYLENGKIERKGNTVQGKRVGDWMIWGEDGYYWRATYNNDGEEISKPTHW